MRFSIILLVLSCAISIGYADPELAAKAHYENGQTLYQTGHYREARAEFVAGFELSHKAMFVLNAAECSRLVGDLETAREDYERYLRLEPKGKQSALAHARLAALATPAPSPAKPPEPARKPEASSAKSPELAPQPTPSPSQAPVASPLPIAPASEVAQQVFRPSPVTGTAPFVAEPPPPIWRRKALWIGVSVALVAGSVAVYATRHHETMCSPPSCVVLP